MAKTTSRQVHPVRIRDGSQTSMETHKGNTTRGHRTSTKKCRNKNSNFYLDLAVRVHTLNHFD
jgi:hypothetical protein